MRQFVDANGQHIEDVFDHAVGVIDKKKNDNLKIYIGSDSQNHRRTTAYALVIAFRYGKRGVHYIHHSFNVRKIRNRRERLWKEIELTMEMAFAFRDKGIHVDTVEFDLNKKEDAGSNFLLSQAVGWGIGSDFNVSTKPDVQVACRAADHLVG